MTTVEMQVITNDADSTVMVRIAIRKFEQGCLTALEEIHQGELVNEG